jgi:sec-independent protein translocase protein TatB
MGTFLNFGPLEILLVAIITLLVFGPERLPTLFRQFGSGIRKMRDMYLALAEQVRRELEPVEEEIKEIRQVAKEVRQDLDDIRGAVDLRAMLPNTTAAEDLAANDVPTITSPAATNAPPVTAPFTESTDIRLDTDNPWIAAPRSASPQLDTDNPWVSP